MFIDDHKDDKLKEINIKTGEPADRIGRMVILAVVVGLIITAGVVYFLYFRQSKPTTPINEEQSTVTGTVSRASSTNTLPTSEENDERNNNFGEKLDSQEAQKLSYGYFYDKVAGERVKAEANKIPGYKLPLNVKSDTINYYDAARKFNLDGGLADLNKNGFAVYNNFLEAKDNSFFDAYNFLLDKKVPLYITSDFLLYYYQNALKDVYKNIEKEAFYKTFWEVNKRFYDIALNRYKKSYYDSGEINDPAIEGQRLQAAYYAVVLELLRPRAGQTTDDTYKYPNLFGPEENLYYSYDLPAFLSEQVKKETDLILAAAGEAKSGIFLYKKNYKDFIVPVEYKKDARLENFYLASRWANSLFPLYYQNQNCPKCLIEKRNDWLINFAAAGYVARDLADNKDLTNEWAKVYKVMSFFSGLRRDLTYIHYHDALTKLFGNDYSVEKIFSNTNQNRDADTSKLQEEIAKLKFSVLEGGFNRVQANWPFIGFKILQDNYAPHEYVFSQLTFPSVGKYEKDAGKLNTKINITACKQGGLLQRCGGFGGDLINLVSELPSEWLDKVWFDNMSYQNYGQKAGSLKKWLAGFNKDSWHANTYWSTLGAARVLLVENNFISPFSSSTAWPMEKIKTVTAAWADSLLKNESLTTRTVKDGEEGEMAAEVFIEPNLDLANELYLNTKTVAQMLYSLGVFQDGDYAAKRLSQSLDDLNFIRWAIKKQLELGVLGEVEKIHLTGILRQYASADKSRRTYRINFPDNKFSVNEIISGVKMMAVVYQVGGEKFLSFGPVYNYLETR